MSIVPEVQPADYMTHMEAVVARAQEELVDADRRLIVAERRERLIREICVANECDGWPRQILDILDGR